MYVLCAIVDTKLLKIANGMNIKKKQQASAAAICNINKREKTDKKPIDP